MRKTKIYLTVITMSCAITFLGCSKAKEQEDTKGVPCGTRKTGESYFYSTERGCYYLNNFGDRVYQVLDSCKCRPK